MPLDRCAGVILSPEKEETVDMRSGNTGRSWQCGPERKARMDGSVVWDMGSGVADESPGDVPWPDVPWHNGTDYTENIF